MLKNTRASIDAIIHDFKVVSILVTVISNLICIGYFTYASVVGTGILAINIATVAVSLAYIIVYALTYGKRGTDKKVHSVASKINSGAKLAFRTVTLAATIYGVIIAGSGSDGITIILATLSILMWIVSFIVEILKYYVEIRFKQLKESLLEDAAPVVSVIKTVSNVYQGVKEEVGEVISEGKETIIHGYETVKNGVEFVAHGVGFLSKAKVLLKKISFGKRAKGNDASEEHKELESQGKKEHIAK